MLPGDPDDANKSTDAEEGKSVVAAQVVVPIATSPVASTSRSQPPKRPAPASSNESLAAGKPVVKKPPKLMSTSQHCLRLRPRCGGPRPMKRSHMLLCFAEFSQLPHDLWLMVMNLLSPLDLLNLARSHKFFKFQDLITRSPKKWGYLDGHDNITSSHVAGQPQHVYRIDYYAAFRFRSFRATLKLLLNNAYFDQFGYGAGWGLPAPEEYKTAPHVRAHTAMLPIKGPKQDLCRQIALLDPCRVAVYADPNGQPGEFGAVLRDVFGLNRQSLWVHFGRQIDEMAILIEAKAPSIRAYMSLYTITEAPNRWYRTLEMNPALVVQFHRTLIPAINTIIEQWERREREIDAVVLENSSPPDRELTYNLKHGFCDEFAALYEELCQSRADARKVVVDPERRQYLVIRRGHGSDEGLVVACINAKIVLATCDYTFGRDRIPGDAKDYLQALDAVKTKLEKAHAAELDPLEYKREYEATMQEWANTQPYNRIPDREKAIDRLLDGRSSGRGNLPEEFDEKDDPILKAYGGAPK